MERRLGRSPLAEEGALLDPQLFKVLASDRRQEILRLLGQRRMTPSELSRRLDLRKATVLEHLGRLVGSGLVRRCKEDGRLWVYYELTQQGTRLVQPARPRVALLLGSGLAAAAAGVALLVVAPQIALWVSAPESVPLGETLAEIAVVQLQTEAVAGTTFSFSALVEGAAGGAGGIEEACLLSYSAGERSCTHLAREARGSLVELRASPVLPAGTYHVYVRDALGRDNLASMPAVRVEAVHAVLLPGAVWHQGLDGPLEVHVFRGGAPVDGLLLLEGEGGAGRTVAVDGGVARLEAQALDGFAPGSYALRFQPEGGGAWAPLAADLEIREPKVSVVQTAEAFGRAWVEVSLDAQGRASAAPVPVMVNGLEAAPAWRKGSTLEVSVDAVEVSGDMDVRVGRLARFEVPARLGLGTQSVWVWLL